MAELHPESNHSHRPSMLTATAALIAGLAFGGLVTFAAVRASSTGAERGELIAVDEDGAGTGGWMFEDDVERAPSASRPEFAVPEDGPINRLAMVTTLDVDVYRKPQIYAPIIAGLRGGRYVVAERAEEGLVGCRMQDGTLGWIEPQHLRILDIPADPDVDYWEDGFRFPEFDTPGATLASGGSAVVRRAYTYLGIPYVWGGTTDSGMDCSGFVQRVFREEGVSIPRVAEDQAKVGAAVSRSGLRPGDRVYFRSGEVIDHTGIYIGAGSFIHSTSSGGGVIVSDLSEARWSRLYAGARR